jgi:hypothetical protein
MSKLHKAERDKLPGSKFAGPDRSYPDNDLTHARKAIQMAPHAGAGAAAIRAKVHRDWPSVSIDGKRAAHQNSMKSLAFDGGGAIPEVWSTKTIPRSKRYKKSLNK